MGKNLGITENNLMSTSVGGEEALHTVSQRLDLNFKFKNESFDMSTSIPHDSKLQKCLGAPTTHSNKLSNG